MSKEAVKNLIKESQSDTQLLARLEAAEGSEAVIKIAQERGYEFTEDELILVMQEEQLSFSGQPAEFNESALKFMKEVDNNQAWKKELEAINTPDDIVRYAADKGYEFTEKDLVAVIQEQQQETSVEGEISDEVLESVAGGLFDNWKIKAKW